MDNGPDRRLLVLLAVLGVLLYAVRIERALAPAPSDPPTPRAALADNMDLYQASLTQGSPYSVTAFQDVERACRQRGDDPQVARACRLFNDAVKHTSSPGEIHQAVTLLRGG